MYNTKKEGGGEGDLMSSIHQWPNQKNISEWLKKDDPKGNAGGIQTGFSQSPQI